MLNTVILPPVHLNEVVEQLPTLCVKKNVVAIGLPLESLTVATVPGPVPSDKHPPLAT